MKNRSTRDLREMLGWRLSRITGIMHRDFDERMQPLGVSRVMWTILSAMRFQSMTSPSGIASYIGINRPVMSRALRQMEKRGLVETRPSPDDGRARVLRLTPAGAALVDEILPRADAMNTHFEGKLRPAERATLFDLLDRLAEGERTDLGDI